MIRFRQAVAVAANVVGLTDQTDLFFTMRDALGLNSSES